MTDDLGTRIAARALSHIGVTFRLHGRNVESGFDCVGLIVDALESVGFSADVPIIYSLRGRFEAQASAFFDRAQFAVIGTGEGAHHGDIYLVKVAANQLHFLIHIGAGFVHAHAGLRRVVVTPGPVPWPVVGQWRYIGD